MSPVIRKKGEKFTIPSKYLLFALSAFCCLLLILSIFTSIFDTALSYVAGYVVIPFQKGITVVGTYLTDRADLFADMQELIAQNESLQEQVDELTVENNRLQQDKYELNELRKLFDLDEEYESYTKTGARIVSSESTNWYYSFVIDKGTNDGLAVNMNVIADGGLVGIITKVGPNWARVTSIISDDVYIMSQLLSTQDNLLVEGDLSLIQSDGVISFSDLLDTTDSAVVGDKVVTSNISDKFLPGLVVGYIQSIETDANNMTKSGTILPAVDFNHLEEVLVILELKETYEEE
ncbi:MAG: rod shape-determining protein MreC [Lachnospiraceae bacterium]|nr:rod shape-determining protein MreC [Lachnospiraceae bacterium]